MTGASAGIGRAFALALAARGFDLVVVARDEQRLRDLAAQLGNDHDASTEVLIADLVTEVGIAAVVGRLEERARPIELVVNNAGFGTRGRFWELDADHELEEVHLNVAAVVRLTHAAIGPMVDRGSGGVINVSSVAAYQPVPFSAVYSATKAFVSSFTNALHEELRHTGVRAMVLAPGFTHTEFHERSGVDVSGWSKIVWQEADEVVEHALRSYERGRAVCVPGAFNKIAAAFSGTMPAVVGRKVAAVISGRAR